MINFDGIATLFEPKWVKKFKEGFKLGKEEGVEEGVRQERMRKVQSTQTLSTDEYADVIEFLINRDIEIFSDEFGGLRIRKQSFGWIDAKKEFKYDRSIPNFDK